MERFTKVVYGGKEYPVQFKQTRKFSHTTMKKRGVVRHVTTSNSFRGGLEWLVNGYDPATRTFGNGGSAMLIVGQQVGEVAMLGELNQMLWHAGNVFDPSESFKKIAPKSDTSKSGYVNPNLYLDGIEFVGGVDSDHSGKVEEKEINLTEWQYACGVQFEKWHEVVNGYTITDGTNLIHQDIDSRKPDLDNVADELDYRLKIKDTADDIRCSQLQTKVVAQDTAIKQLFAIIKVLFTLIKR